MSYVHKIVQICACVLLHNYACACILLQYFLDHKYVGRLCTVLYWVKSQANNSCPNIGATQEA